MFEGGVFSFFFLFLASLLYLSLLFLFFFSFSIPRSLSFLDSIRPCGLFIPKWKTPLAGGRPPDTSSVSHRL
jgi:hypothetical protein